MRMTRTERESAAQRREQAEQRRKTECARDCTVESLIAASREARARGDRLAGVSPFSHRGRKHTGFIFCPTHLLHVPIEWEDAPTEEE